MSMKKRFIALAVIAGMLTAVSCGEEPESSVTDDSSSTIETTAEIVTEAETEPETETEPVTTEEITTEAVTEEVSEEDEEADEVLTNAELLSLINNVFGMMSDGTFETDLETAKTWDIVDEDADIDPEAEITVEFLVSASMRATGMVTGDSSIDEIIDCAVEKGVIEDMADVDISKAVDVVNNAYYAWTHREFDSYSDIQFADNVIDLTGMVDASECEIDGDTIKLPASLYDSIPAGSVIIIPDGSESGKAYKTQSVIDTGDGTITVHGDPADLTTLDGFIGN